VSTDPILESHAITEADVKGPFAARIPEDNGEMAKLKRLAYRNSAEKLAELFHMDEDFLRQLNPRASFEDIGTPILVVRRSEPAKTPVARVVADKTRHQILGYDAKNHLIVAYPATIGSSELPSPSGRHAVSGIAFNPVYHYRPDVNFKQGNNTRPLLLAPGPNNPVGLVWIALTEPTYGIHGTPEPSRIDKTNSHGCVRLTNWNAVELAHLVKKGVPVEFSE
jgi:lipoprotein-anchoring transpeptidase ErfK/SrfK